ncbi:MAG: YihY/virulence factor BrkB family protein [Verrucomicrobia bacterium]|nr:YihY/virulence factor BrkB family protein [Verrucomicrobiota bacterium]
MDIKQAFRSVWGTTVRAFRKFSAISGDQGAAAFGFYAFFSIFPLLLLFITIGSLFIDQQAATSQILGYAENYLPMNAEYRGVISETIEGLIENREGVGIVAFVTLVWGATRFFRVLVHAVNQGWNCEEYSWWKLPLQNFMMLGILASALVLGIITPAILRAVRDWLPIQTVVFSFLFDVALWLIPSAVLFYGFSMLYKLAPRRSTRFAEIWKASLLVTILLQVAQLCFVFYLQNFGNFNAVYGTFGGIIALLLWIYISGAIVIFGGCVCAAQNEKRQPA